MEASLALVFSSKTRESNGWCSDFCGHRAHTKQLTYWNFSLCFGTSLVVHASSIPRMSIIHAFGKGVSGPAGRMAEGALQTQVFHAESWRRHEGHF